MTRGQGVGNLSSGCGCVCECVVHACGSLLCHGEEGGGERRLLLLNKNVFIFKEGERRGRLSLQFLSLLKHRKRIFHHLKAPRRGGEGETEREVQRRETASQSCEAEVMDSAHRKVTVFS